MNRRERDICVRARYFREGIRWSQSDFAAQIGISVDQLASIEYCRTPLRYSIAWNYRSCFGISLESLAEKGYPVLHRGLNAWPEPSTLEANVLLSEAWDLVGNASCDPPVVADIEAAKESPENAPPPAYVVRAFWLESLQDDVKRAVSSVTYKDVPKLSAELSKAITERLKLFTSQSEEVTSLAESELGWYLLRKEIARRLLIKSPEKSGLPKVSESFNNNSVKPLMPKLLERLNKATSERGKKTELANFLGAHLVSVSQWLSGKQVPGGETTLKMLQWVEQRERQK